MSVDPNAGKLPEPTELTDLPRLVSAYYTLHPDPENPADRVAFGTSGHRGSSLRSSFNEDHILAITQAIVEYRAGKSITASALSRHGHARAQRARLPHGA